MLGPKVLADVDGRLRELAQKLAVKASELEPLALRGPKSEELAVELVSSSLSSTQRRGLSNSSSRGGSTSPEGRGGLRSMALHRGNDLGTSGAGGRGIPGAEENRAHSCAKNMT